MTIETSLVMAYYQNPGMLAEQYRVWAAYPTALKRAIEIILVDDSSPGGPAIEVPRPAGLPALRIYRVLIDRPWNQHGARNLGAREATAPWLLLTDMDHVVPAASLEAVSQLRNPAQIYTFLRLDAPGLTATVRPDGTAKPHPNTFLMTRDLYWRIGGYDERFCGIYGTDGLFRARARAHAEMVYLRGIPIVRYPRTVIPDASTTTLSRKEGRGDRKKQLQRRLRDEGTADQIEILTFPWERLL